MSKNKQKRTEPLMREMAEWVLEQDINFYELSIFAKYCYNRAVEDAAESVELKEYRETPQDIDTIGNDMGDIWGVDKQSILKLKIT